MGHVIAVKRNHIYPLTVRLEVMTCPACGIVYGIPEDFADALRRNGRPDHYYCPNGHDLGWSESEADRQRRRAEQAERHLRGAQDTADRWRENAERERRSAIALRGHLTRWRKRVANGVCPVAGCHRHFPNVQAHVASEHPAWMDDHPEVFEVIGGA